MSEFWQALFGGLGAGLVICFMIGPVFFALIQASLKSGFKTAIFFALGIVTSDSIFFSLAYGGVSIVNSIKNFDHYLALFGGIFLIVYGLILVLKKPKSLRNIDDTQNEKNGLLKNYFKGFLLNTLNPSIIPLWMGVIVKMQRNLDKEFSTISVFFVACMSMIFITDLGKAFGALRLKKIITTRFIFNLNRGIGVFLIGAGAIMLYKGFVK